MDTIKKDISVSSSGYCGNMKCILYICRPTAVTFLLISSDYTVDEQPSETVLIQELESSRAKPLVFVLNANLLAMVKLVNCMFPPSLFLVCWDKSVSDPFPGLPSIQVK